MTGVTVASRVRHLDVAWSRAAAAPGHAAATGYRVQWAVDGEDFDAAREERIDDVATTSRTLRLPAGLAYSVRVIAVNAAGVGQPSGTVPGTSRVPEPLMPVGEELLTAKLRVAGHTGTAAEDVGFGHIDLHGRGSLVPGSFTREGRTVGIDALLYAGSALYFVPKIAIGTGYFVLDLDDRRFSFGAPTDVTLPSGLCNGCTRGYAIQDHGLAWIAGDRVKVWIGQYRVPAAPGELAAGIADGSAALSWTAPGSELPIEKYQYRVSTDGGTTWDPDWTDIADGDDAGTDAGDETAYAVDGLANGTRHEVQLRAVSAAGTSQASRVAVTPAAVPGMPESFAAVRGDRSASLSWLAPSSSGGSAVVGYRYRVSTDGGATWDPDWTEIPDGADTDSDRANETRLTLTGLDNGTEYVVELAAENEVGTGPASRATVTPAVAPGAPGRFRLVASAGTVELSWEEPSETGGDAIVKYRYRVSTDGGTNWQPDWTDVPDGDGDMDLADERSHSVAGLANGTVHTLQLVAVNTVGESVVVQGTATPARVPGPPSELTASLGDRSAELSWSTPTDPGETAIVKYRYRVSADGGTTWDPDWTDVPDGDGDTDLADERSHVVTELANGTEHTIELRAVNETGDGVPARATVTPAVPPGMPGGFRLAPQTGSAALAWTAPSQNGGVAVTGYEYRVSADGGITWDPDWMPVPDAGGDGNRADETAYTVTGLDNGTLHTIQLRAVNAAGGGEPSSATVTPATVPGVPGGFRLAPGTGSAALAWASTDTGGSPILRFEYRVSTDGGSTWDPDWTTVPDSDDPDDDPGDETSFTVSDLADGSEHLVALRAVNALGAGEAVQDRVMPVSAGANQAAEGAPAIAGTVQMGLALRASLGTLADPDGLPATTFPDGYRIQWVRVDLDGASNPVEIANATAQNYTPVDADLGKRLRVRVRFTDAKGGSEERFSEATEPVAPRDTVAPTVTSIVRWMPPSSPTNADSLAWRVTFSEAVENVDPADFAVSGTTATLAVTAVTGATPANSQFDVTASEGNLAGLDATVALSFASGHGITDTATNALASTTPTGTKHNTYEVDNTAPTVTYAASGSLQVGVAIAEMTPSSTDTDIASYGATGLPSGLSIATATGVISGTPDTASSNTVTATVTVTDAAGNTATVDIAFPAVARGTQTLTGFAYSADSVPLGTTAPTLTPPTGAETMLGYTASPATVCTVHATTGVLTLVGPGECVVTATAAEDANWNEASATYTVTVEPAGTLVLNLGTIAGDDTINIAEKAAGFEIAGDTGSEAGVSVTVTVGSATLNATSVDDNGTARWSVDVPAAAAYITGTGVSVTINAAKTNYTAATEVTRTLTVDLVAPTVTSVERHEPASSPTNEDSVTWRVTFSESVENVDPADFSVSGTTATLAVTAVTGATPANSQFDVTASEGNLAGLDATVALSFASGHGITDTAGNALASTTPSGTNHNTYEVDNTAPTVTYAASGSLQVGVAIAEMTPSSTDTDIATYSATDLPSGLSVNASTGVISGTPATASTATTTATVTVSDTAGNEETVDIAFPAVAKGTQTLTGFAYSADSVTFGTAALTVTAPNGARTALTYTASPGTVCTVHATTGVLTLVGAGECVVTATAAGTDNYNEASDTFTITVRAAGTLVLNLGTIAGDDTINIAEKAAGFAIAGDTGSEAGVSVTVTVGSATLSATSADDNGTARWSVDVPAAASYITGTSVAVTVTASKEGYTAPAPEERTLTVDLEAPTLTSVERHEPASSPTNEDSLTWRVTFSESVENVDPADFSVSETTATLTANDVTAATPANSQHDVTASGGDLAALNATVTLSFATGQNIADTAGNALASTTPSGTNDKTYKVDNTAPTVTYASPGSLQVGVAITEMTPSSTDTDIASYSATDLPSGLSIDTDTGVISGTPDTAGVAASAKVTVSDAAGNTATVDIALPAVAKGDQTLSGFEYSAAAVTLGATAPTLTPPTGAETMLGYTASPVTVCTVHATTGVLTLVGAGECVVTATAAGTDNYNEASDTFTITVRAAGTLELSVDPIAGDNTINIAEKAAGFTIAGATGSEAGVTVSVTVGGAAVAAATSAADGRWSVSVPAAASYITGTSVAVTVTASKEGYTAPAPEERTLTVDLEAPTLTSVERHEPTSSPTNEDSLTWRVTFSESVENVDPADFSVSETTAALAANDVTAATPANSQHDVTASGGDLAALNATVTLSFATGQNIADTGGNALASTTPSGTNHNTYEVDNIAPTVTYAASGSLQVGVSIAEMTPSSTDTDIAWYSAGGLPSGLSVNASTGAISGTPDTASTATTPATVTVSDTAGNEALVTVSFPAVAKGDQTLSGFKYSADSVTFGTAAPTVTAPSGARTTLTYTASPVTVCTVHATTGVLTLVGAGRVRGHGDGGGGRQLERGQRALHVDG